MKLLVISASDFAENRLKLAEILYYKVLENVLVQETKRLQGRDMSVSGAVVNSVADHCGF